MRGAFVAVVGAAVIVLSIAGLVEHEQRAGPLDTTLEPVVLEVQARGTYEAQPGNPRLGGLCIEPPCDPSTRLDLRMAGLPPADYEVLLDGTPLPFRHDGQGIVVEWQDASDHGDARLAVQLAQREIVALDLRPGPIDVAAPATWDASPTRLQALEIGGVTVSVVATARLHDAPPPGWVFVAYLDGPSGRVDLGPLGGEDGVVLDARIERAGLEHHRGLGIALRSDSAEFPVLRAEFPWAQRIGPSVP